MRIRRLFDRAARLFSRKRESLQEQYQHYAIGKGTYGDPQILTWNEGAALKIGAFCSIAEGVKIFLGGEHRIDWVTTYPFSVVWEKGRHIAGHPRTRGDVVIGNDVWIGSEAVILSGVTIGDGAVIGTRSVVRRDVAPYAIVVGNPARLVMKRFDDATIHQLLELKWWNWPDEEIADMLPFLLSSDVDAFLARAKERDEKG
ncbi:MAG TPA: CatB-related O-acetyltransferase [Thermodesulfovibrionales bacterium]|nr:CatB-related O-acetyltransferase [Thermodesulfovibrionales bacterium]